jgi:hypothetical protein
MIAPTMSDPSSCAALRFDTVKRQPKRVYERALAARLKRIAGPPGALAATIAVGLADYRQRRISVTLKPKSITI